MAASEMTLWGAAKRLLLIVLKDHNHSIDKLLAEVEMATDPQQVFGALDVLHGTIDLTQENVKALLVLVKAAPSQELLDQIKGRLEEMNADLTNTNFDPNNEPDEPQG